MNPTTTGTTTGLFVMRNRLIIAAKLAISGGVIFAIGRRVEVNQLISSLQHVDPFYLVMATTLAFLAVPVVGNRWRLLAGMLSIQISTAVATRATFAGLFVGQVLPGAIGADVVRGWMVWHMGLRNKLVIASLVADRIASLLAIALMIGASLPMLLPYLPKKIILWVEWSLFSLVIILPIGYLCFRLIRSIKTNKTLGRLLSRLSIESINISARVVFASLGLAVLGHSLTILSAFFLSLAIGIDSSLWMWGLVMPIIILVTAIPISINGWGIREFAMIHLWALFGIAEPEAFLISICLGIVAIVSSLPGLWFWLEKKRKTHIDSMHIGDNITSIKVSP